MSIKVRFIALITAVLFVPCLAMAEETYNLFPFAGGVEFVSYSNDSVYVQATVEYTPSY